MLCECCNSCIDHIGMPLEDAAVLGGEDLDVPQDCADVLVMRGADPVVTETWCELCILAAKRRGVYEFEGRRTFGRRHERVNRKGWGAQPLRVRLVSEDYK